MCQLISGVAVLSGDAVKVFTLPGSDSHLAIRAAHNIRDDDGVGTRQTPVEYSPGSTLTEFDDWVFRFDDLRPAWWTDAMTDDAQRQLIRAFRARFEKNGHYGGSLDLQDTGITALPDGLTVGGSLDLQGCTGITALPDGLTVGGSLDLWGCTGITEIPQSAQISDDIYR